MKILLVNAYLRNTGDAALSSVVISQLRRVWPQADITVSSVEDPAEWPAFEHCPNIGSIRLYAGLVNGNKLRRMARKALVLAVELGWPRLPAGMRHRVAKRLPRMIRDELQTLTETDLVVSTAGGYLGGANSLGGDLSVRYMLLPLKLASATGKPVVLAPQSYGAFGNQRQEQAVRRTLSRAQCIMTREGKSFELLRSLGIPEKLMVKGVDAAFAFDPQLGKRRAKSGKRPLQLGITTRSWLTPDKQKAYEQALAQFIVAVQARHHLKVKLISHVIADVYEAGDGVVVERRIAELVRQAGGEVEQLETDPDQHAMKRIYNGLDYMIGTRFHSVIFSLTAGVPSIAIEYQHKTSGIMRDLGLSQWVIAFEDVTTDRLLDLFDKLCRQRAAYERQLQAKLPPYIDQANKTGETIKRAYERWQRAADTRRAAQK